MRFSYNGLPGNTLDIVADGAHVSDPGCNCDTPVNPNSDFLQEFRVLTSNFSAEEQKGPMVITSVTKAGGSEFHGGAFFYARNYVLNSNDAYSNATRDQAAADKYYYPGGDIGGPVIIPGTHFNKNHDKLFFFTGYEYFYQVLDTGLLTATVPTAGDRTGNFSPAEVAKEGIKNAAGLRRSRCSSTAAHLPDARQPDRSQHAEADESVSAAECRPQRNRRLQLRTVRDLQPKQLPVDLARRLQHQRQH